MTRLQKSDKGVIKALCFKEITNDLLFPDTGMVPKVNIRGNFHGGITLGCIPASNSTVPLYGNGCIAEQTIMAGTKCYLPTFINMLKLANELASLGSFPQPLSNVGGFFNKCPNFAAAIDEGNILKCLTSC
jgi:hypothetical protein